MLAKVTDDLLIKLSPVLLLMVVVNYNSSPAMATLDNAALAIFCALVTIRAAVTYNEEEVVREKSYIFVFIAVCLYYKSIITIEHFRWEIRADDYITYLGLGVVSGGQ